jgi:signal transduction histidine kinase
LVVLKVEDSGQGMPAEVHKRIFEPFFTTKSVGKGTGMGLSVLHGLIHQFGGHVTVESIEGQYTKFFLFFPVHGIGQYVDDNSANHNEGEVVPYSVNSL